MSERLVLLAHRQMRLIIEITKFVLMPFFYFFGMLLIKVVGTLSTLVHEIPGKVQVFFLPGQFIKPHKGHLCDFMSRITVKLSLFRTEICRHIVCKSFRRLQQLVLASRLKICHSPFNQVSEAVQLVMVLQIRKGRVTTT